MPDATDPQVDKQRTAERLTVDVALTNAARLLYAAELETNLALMERLEKLADSWVSIAGWIAQRDRDA
jgi:hypothetical protein